MLIVIGLIFAYSEVMFLYRVDYIEVPIVAQQLTPRTKITETMVSMTKVSREGLPTNIYEKKEDIIGKYVDITTTLQTSSYFFKESIFDQSELPDEPHLKLMEGQSAFSVNADLLKSSGNTLVEGQYVDVYGSIFKNNQTVIIDKMLESVRIIGVKDGKGNDVDGKIENQIPKVIILAVKSEEINALKKVVKWGALDFYPSTNKPEEGECIRFEDSKIFMVVDDEAL